MKMYRRYGVALLGVCAVVAACASGSRSPSATGGASGSGTQASGHTSTLSTLPSTSSSIASSRSSSSSSAPVTGPCDIFGSGGTPCVAAHSTVRALYGSYTGSLYQVRRADHTTKDIPLLTPGGFADSSIQDSFCQDTTCTISTIYDQSGMGNHLMSAPGGGAAPMPDNEANATDLKLTVGGHKVYGVHIPRGVGYRVNVTLGVATGDDPETEYMVTSGTYVNGGCCFDYGNAETDNNNDGEGTMEAIYFGTCTWWGKGSGTGPWVMGDLENGLWAGATTPNNANASVTFPYVTAMVKGDSGNHWAIKAGNAQAGSLTTMWDGARPNGYNPMKKQGAIILGIGGDNSNGAQGNFFEGVMTSGYASDATDNAVQANIVAAGYQTHTVPGYIGCYGDSQTRDLPEAAYQGNGSATVESCISACQSAGYKYAGAQDSTQCFCGNSYGAYGPSSSCSVTCPGSSVETCGGSWANSVYATGN